MRKKKNFNYFTCNLLLSTKSSSIFLCCLVRLPEKSNLCKQCFYNVKNIRNYFKEFYPAIVLAINTLQAKLAGHLAFNSPPPQFSLSSLLSVPISRSSLSLFKHFSSFSKKRKKKKRKNNRKKNEWVKGRLQLAQIG